ncbi:glucosamine-6-phosphate deaminase [Arenicella chitinivorans]|uniref:Glucosamine-6-phosphate deaminase n=1 Tax=Arenicella chitinivorans TaxID=1329800 RepID=A0A918RIZ0_9GAMM|nr:glucosamine-6-phosphate deaminase [Arenicella chitinivorans]GGZ98055.1 glucosamine-6-phosphate deaminase [Arenicella chitinivorans]
MRVVIVGSAHDAAAYGCDLFLGQLHDKPTSVFGLATGSTPLALYQALIDAHRNQGISFAQVTTFNLDEYVGLAGDHSQSYRHFMQRNLFDCIDVAPENTHVPNGMAENAELACAEYEAQIMNAGGIDLQLLGVGRNGHIGFNEPSSSLVSRTRVKTLTEGTIADNARFFADGEYQPSLSLTMGIGTIMDARRVLLIATGDSKADAMRAAIEGPVSAACPASILQMHADAIVVMDEAAAAKLRNAEFYRFVETQRIKLAAKSSAA